MQNMCGVAGYRCAIKEYSAAETPLLAKRPVCPMVMFEAAACENTKLANKALAMLDELGANSKKWPTTSMTNIMDVNVSFACGIWLCARHIDARDTGRVHPNYPMIDSTCAPGTEHN